MAGNPDNSVEQNNSGTAELDSAELAGLRIRFGIGKRAFGVIAHDEIEGEALELGLQEAIQSSEKYLATRGSREFGERVSRVVVKLARPVGGLAEGVHKAVTRPHVIARDQVHALSDTLKTEAKKHPNDYQRTLGFAMGLGASALTAVISLHHPKIFKAVKFAANHVRSKLK